MTINIFIVAGAALAWLTVRLCRAIDLGAP